MIHGSDYIIEALDGQGFPYQRPARYVCELPSVELVKQALHDLACDLAAKTGLQMVAPPAFGLPLFYAFGLRAEDAKKSRHAKLLLTQAAMLPLN